MISKVKNKYTAQAIQDAGYSFKTGDGVTTSSNDTAVQAIIDTYNPLPDTQAEAITRVKVIASEKAAVIYPFIDGTTEQATAFYQFAEDLYTSISPASREPISGSLLEFKNIRDVAESTIADINAMTDWTLVQKYDAVNTPLWP